MLFRKCCFFISLLLVSTAVLPNEFNFESDDDFFFNLGDGPVRQGCTNANLIVPPLFECKILDILKNDIFLKTNDLNSRSILDMPLFQSPFPNNDALSITINLFFNKTDRCFFTSCSDRISSYLALQDPVLLESIDTAFETIKTSECGEFFINTLGIPVTVFDTNVGSFFNLFANAVVEQRKIGFMADVYKKFDNWTIGFKLPVYWIERNFFLSQAEQDALGAAGLVFEQAPNDTLEFQSDHLISDQVGFGDTRLFAAYEFLNKNDARISLGAQLTIPTALAVQKGVLGSEFKSCLPVPSLDLCAILNLGLNPAALERRIKQDLETFGIEFIDRLAAMLNEYPLGNKGHCGLGLFLEPSFNFNNTLAWRTHLSFEQLLPAMEQRFFLKKFNEEAWDAHNFASDDEQVAEDNVRAINQRIIDMFFPSLCEVRVLPGPIIFCSNYLTYTASKKADVMIGIDYWYQGQERFLIPHTSKWFRDYDIKKALNPSAQQLKILGGVSYKRGTPEDGWLLSLNADKTIFSSGIGKDYTFSFLIRRTW